MFGLFSKKLTKLTKEVIQGKKSGNKFFEKGESGKKLTQKGLSHFNFLFYEPIDMLW